MSYKVWMENDITLKVAMFGSTQVGSNVWIVASLNLLVGDWAVYEGEGDYMGVPLTAKQTAHEGEKVDEKFAANLFPQFATGFRYRP